MQKILKNYNLIQECSHKWMMNKAKIFKSILKKNPFIEGGFLS